MSESPKGQPLPMETPEERPVVVHDPGEGTVEVLPQAMLDDPDCDLEVVEGLLDEELMLLVESPVAEARVGGEGSKV